MLCKGYVEPNQSCHKVEPEGRMNTWLGLFYKLARGVVVLCDVTNESDFQNCAKDNEQVQVHMGPLK